MNTLPLVPAPWWQEFVTLKNLGPARLSNKGQSRKRTSFFPSLKNDTRLYCEVALEASYCYHLEFDKSVLGYLSQPYLPEAIAHDLEFQYTPDFYVLYVDKPPQFIQVKPQNWELDIDLVTKMDICEHVFARYDRIHRVVTSQFIYQNPLFINLQKLYTASHPIQNTMRYAFDMALHETRQQYGEILSVGQIKSVLGADHSEAMYERAFTSPASNIAKVPFGSSFEIDLSNRTPFWQLAHETQRRLG